MFFPPRNVMFSVENYEAVLNTLSTDIQKYKTQLELIAAAMLGDGG